MIYEYPGQTEPIRQGDIFLRLPRIDLDLTRLAVVGDDDIVESSWSTEVDQGTGMVKAVVAMRPVNAIVITQDCDASRADQITLCEIRPFGAVLGGNVPDKPAKWVSLITRQSRQNLKWFYLPPDATLGFGEKMAVDYQVTISVLRTDLEALRSSRKGRLNPEADEHFRERLSEFFRRYPVDEWYPFDKPEFVEYQKNAPEAQPRPWQT